MLNKDRFFTRDDKQQKPAPTYPYAPAPQRPLVVEVPAADAAKPVAKEAAAGQEGSRLIVGPNIKLKGVEITDCDTLVVEGHVEATMDSRAIQIAQSGTFTGTAGIDVAEIHGEFSGELTARKRLIIHATGKVSGRVRYGKLVIEEGGELTGEVRTLSADEQRRPAATAAAPRPVVANPATPH
jgi:cytoskeletal protein CcmA (bactofilin family)